MSELASQVRAASKAFADHFGRPPRFAAAAPGRVNLIGEHTDYNDGFVLPMAIDRWAVVAADHAVGDRSSFWAPDLQQRVTVELATGLAPGEGGPPGTADASVSRGFAGYLLGVLAEFSRLGGDGPERRPPELDVALTGTVPIGAGLASSAAVEVAFATLLEQLLGFSLDPAALAALCQRAEHAFAGTPCGIMDMLTAVEARAGHALFIDCRTLHARPIAMPPADRLTVLIVDTALRRHLAKGAYAERRSRCAAAAGVLGVGSLRDADLGLLAGSSLTGTPRLAARHVICENERTLLAAAALTTGDLDLLGELMFLSHASLRDCLEVSCPRLDVIVESAATLRGAGGVIGARLTGAGFGGCAVVLCRTEAAGRVADVIGRAFENSFGERPACFATTATGAARVVEVRH